MRASLLAKAGAVSLTLGIAMAGAVGTANAATATTPHRLPSNLTIAAAQHKALHNDAINGVLKSRGVRLPNREVYLERTDNKGHFIVIRKQLTNKLGAVHFVVAPKVKRRFVLVFTGSPVFKGSRSPVVVLKAVK